MQGLSVSKLKSTEIFLFFFLLLTKKSISNYLRKSAGLTTQNKTGQWTRVYVMSCCAKASFLRPGLYLRHACLGAGTPAVLLPLPSLTPALAAGAATQGPQAPPSPLPPPHAPCLLQGWARPRIRKAPRPLRPPAFRSATPRVPLHSRCRAWKRGGKIRPSLEPAKPHTSLWAT